MAKLSREDILKLAQLARLKLSESEVSEFADEISAILTYVEQLQKVDITNLEPTTQVTQLKNVTRQDEEKTYGYDPQDLLAIVPRVQDNQIKTNRMIR